MSSSKREDESERLLASVARYTRVGVRSTQEVHAFLQRRGAAPAMARQVVALCQARGLLDDRTCARLWAEHWARRGCAWASIRVKLSAKGLSEESITAVARQFDVPSEEMARARRVVGARLARDTGVRERARLARTLTARGFDADVIDQLLSESLDFPATGGIARDAS